MRNVLALSIIWGLGSLRILAQEDVEMGKPDLYGPEFQKRFIASYGVLESREPELQELEISLLEKIGPMVEENPQFAKNMLEGMLGEDNPASATFNFILANLYFNGGALDDALDEYNRAIEKYPAFRRAWKNMGMLKVRQADYEGGLKALVRCVELGDTSPDTYGTTGYCHLRVGNLLAAELAYNSAIVLEPTNIQWIEGKTQALIQAKRFSEALPLLGELIDRNPQKGAYRMFQANVFVELEQYLDAALAFEMIHLLGEGTSDTRLQLANIYSVSGYYELAVDTFLSASPDELRPQLKQALMTASFLMDKNEKEQAKRLLAKIGPPELEWPTDTKVQFVLLESEIAYSDGDEALMQAKLFDALEIDPLNGTALLRLGKAHRDRGENAKAMYYFERAYDSEGHEFDALVYMSEMLIDEKRFSESLGLLRRAMELKPSDELRSLIAQVRAATSYEKN